MHINKNDHIVLGYISKRSEFPSNSKVISLKELREIISNKNNISKNSKYFIFENNDRSESVSIPHRGWGSGINYTVLDSFGEYIDINININLLKKIQNVSYSSYYLTK